MRFFHLVTDELSAHLALFHFVISEIMRICSRKSLVEAVPVTTKLPLKLNLRDKIGRRGRWVILNVACLYLEGEISE